MRKSAQLSYFCDMMKKMILLAAASLLSLAAQAQTLMLDVPENVPEEAREVLVQRFTQMLQGAGVMVGESGEPLRIEATAATGGQWIDTGYCPKSTTRTRVDFQPLETTTQQRVFGAGGSGTFYQMYRNGSSKWAYAYITAYDGNWVNTGYAANNTTRRFFDLNYWDDGLKKRCGGPGCRRIRFAFCRADTLQVYHTVQEAAAHLLP